MIETLLLAVQIYEVYMYAETFSQPKDKTKFWRSPTGPCSCTTPLKGIISFQRLFLLFVKFLSVFSFFFRVYEMSTDRISGGQREVFVGP